ncbi:SRPBCC family protein [Bosea sp. (in: a-proteobacteria)]|jgi:uncharacterized protein YndB with AHSA1/START domain|uniref:SRPBCC family protein n=1 Tax=Bosea sp. (in: a-proteobacteria) TaxID=1871050 RepID=UPI003F6F8D41
MTTTPALSVTTPSEREIRMTRIFDAPRALVFEAMHRPELLKRWLSGPPGWSLAECEADFRVGGAFRHLWHGPDGAEMGMGGVFREIAAPERIVRTEIFDQDWTGGEALATLVLSERAGKTELAVTVLYSSREARDGALASGMKDGVAASYANLDTLLAGTKRAA